MNKNLIFKSDKNCKNEDYFFMHTDMDDERVEYYRD